MRQRHNIGLQRTAPCGLAAEAASLGGRRISMSKSLVLSAIACFLASAAGATSARNVHFELAGLKTVSVSVDTAGVQGIERDDLVKQIYQHLAKANVGQSGAGASAPLLFIRVVRNWSLSACPGMLSVQVSIALREPVTILRNRRLGSVVAETWGESGVVTILSASEAAEHVTREALGLVDSFASDVAYASEVVAKEPKP